MITDLLRNDLGRVCEFGSVQKCPNSLRTLRPHKHLVSAVEGRLRSDVTHFAALASAFPAAASRARISSGRWRSLMNLNPSRAGRIAAASAISASTAKAS